MNIAYKHHFHNSDNIVWRNIMLYLLYGAVLLWQFQMNCLTCSLKEIFFPKKNKKAILFGYKINKQGYNYKIVVVVQSSVWNVLN